MTTPRIPSPARTRALLGALLLAASALAGCGGGAATDGTGTTTGGGTTGGTTGGTAGSNYTLAVDANPLTVRTTIDSSRQAAVDMPLEGGTLRATGADGTVYTLTVPGDALLAPARITMAPLASLTGLPFGEAMRGVQLGPDGLQFNRPVRLDIRLPAGTQWPLAQQVPIGMQGSNNTVSLASLDPTAAVPGFQLMHFSSYALLLSQKGVNASLVGLRQRLGGSAEERLQSAVAEQLMQERQHQLLGTPVGDTGTALLLLMKQYETEVLDLRLAAAGSSCAAGKLAMHTMLSYERSRQLMGLPDGKYALGQSMTDLLKVAAPVCMKEEFEICRDEHIITRIVPVMLGLKRQQMLMGGDDQLPAAAEVYAEKCLRFELQFASSVQLNSSNNFGFGSSDMPHTMSERVESRLAVHMDSWQFIGNGSLMRSAPAPLVARDYSVSFSDPCNTVSALQTIGGQAQVTLMSWHAQDGGVAERATLKDFRVFLDFANTPNRSQYMLTHRERTAQGCANASSTDVHENWSNTGGLQMFGLYSIEEPFPGLTGWSIHLGSARIATKDIDVTQTDVDSSTRLRASLVLVHQPAAQ